MSTSLRTLIHLLERESYVINRRAPVPPRGPQKHVWAKDLDGLLGINKLSIFIYKAAAVDGRKHGKWIVVQESVEGGGESKRVEVLKLMSTEKEDKNEAEFNVEEP